MSDTSIPAPGGQQPTPPVAPIAPAPPAYQPAPPAPPTQTYSHSDVVPSQPTQAYPGAAPSFSSGQQPYGGPAPQPYGGPQQQPYGSAPQQPYASSPQQPYPVVGQSPAGYPAYAAPAPRPTSGLATTSLICGIAGVVLFWAVVPLLASIVAVITGHMALRQTKADPAIGGRGMAFAGLIMGYIMIGFLVIGIIMTIVSFVFVGAFTLPFVFSS